MLRKTTIRSRDSGYRGRASMRPQRNAAENPATIQPLTPVPDGFNEAAA